MASTYGAPQMAESFRTVRNNTIQIAEDIPETQYGFVSAPGTRSVAQMLAHIALAPRVWQEIHGTGRRTALQPSDFIAMRDKMEAEEKRPRSKAEIIELLRTSGKEFSSWLESLSPEYLAESVSDPTGTKSRFERLLSAKEHEMHHRAQLMLIERQLGIVPHLTRVNEERMRQAARGA